MEKGTIIGIDYGSKRIGLALAHSQFSLALPLAKIVVSTSLESAIDALLHRIKEYHPIQKFIVGLPLLLSGKEGEMCQEVRAFAHILEKKSGSIVVFLDERLTSKHADALLREQKMNRKKRTEVLDTTTATLILQTFLDCSTLK